MTPTGLNSVYLPTRSASAFGTGGMPSARRCSLGFTTSGATATLAGATIAVAGSFGVGAHADRTAAEAIAANEVGARRRRKGNEVMRSGRR